MTTRTSKYKITFQDLGVIDYKKAWDYQEELLQELVTEREEIKKMGKYTILSQKQVILLCEHPHVYTLGKSGKENNLLISNRVLEKIQATYYRINRGGDITYHGPGQIVGYPIIDLESMKIKVKEYVWLLEESIIRCLGEFNIRGERLPGATGVWINAEERSKARKICAIGVRVSNYVTMHGFALNVNTDLNYFKYINPCGFTDKEVTSMKKELGETIDIKSVKKTYKEHFSRVFQIDWLN